MNTKRNARVLIVGAGPVGQLAALLLSKHSVPCLLVDKRETTHNAPKAHAVNPRTLEICESVGVSADHLRRLGASANDGGEVRFVGTLTGPEFGALPYERQDEGALDATPFPLSNIPQPVFEQQLCGAIQARTNIEFRRGVTCAGLTDNGTDVEAVLLDTGANSSETRRFDYAIAADGAGSSIRESLGIAMEGQEALQEFLMIHFTVDLSHLTEQRRGVLYFLFDPAVQGTLIAYDHAKTWVLMHPWDPQTEKLADYDDNRCRDLLAKAVGQPVSETIVENISPWSMSAQIARHYRSGRIYLTGDAAHRFPPSGGLGLNTGAGDVQNLCWKLAAVLRSEAGDALLDTYEIERRTVAHTNSEQSLMNAAKIFDLIVAVHGADPDKVVEHYAAVADKPGAFPDVAAAVAAQRPHFDSFNLQLGYRYTSDAIHEPAPVPGLTDVSDYRPSWESGAHFPHRRVRVNGQQTALQQLLPADRFSLIRGPRAPADQGPDDLNQLCWGTDFIDRDAWTTQTGLPETGALLVRPDGHIAARFADLASAPLDSVMDSLLARSS